MDPYLHVQHAAPPADPGSGPASLTEMMKLMESVSAGLRDEEDNDDGAAPVDIKVALTHASSLVTNACAEHTVQLGALVARTSAMLTTSAPSVASLQATADGLFSALQIPAILSSALAPLPLPRIPSISPATKHVSSMDLHCFSVDPASTLAWLPGSLPSTAATAIPPALDHEDRSEERYLNACGGYACNGRAPSEGTDRSGCRTFNGLAAWQAAVADVLQLLIDVLDILRPHAESLCPWTSSGPFVAVGSAHVMPALLVGCLSASPWASFAPWSDPLCFHRSGAVIDRCIGIMTKQVDVSGEHSVSAAGLPESFNATEILLWTREVTKNGVWKNTTCIPVRYMVTWALTRLRSSHLSAEGLGHVMPTILRFCDDWEVTSCWLSASALIHIMTSAASSELQTHEMLILEVLRRLSLVRNPAIIVLWSCTAAIAPWILSGPPKLSLGDGAVLPRSSACELNTSQDIAVLQMMRDTTLCGTDQLARATLFGLPLLVVQCGRHFLRHLQEVVPQLARIISESSDPDLVLQCMHTLHFIIQVAADRFNIGDDEYEALVSHGGYTTLSDRVKAKETALAGNVGVLHALCRCDLIEHVVCTLYLAVQNAAQASLLQTSGTHTSEDAKAIDRLSFNILSLLVESPGTRRFVSWVVTTMHSAVLSNAALDASTSFQHSFSTRPLETPHFEEI
jgi:hypothetical protein